MDEVSGVAVVFGGAFCLTRGFRGWRRGMRGVVAALRRVRFFVSQFLGEGGAIGVLCFSLGSRLRGNDGGHPPRSLRFYRSLGPPSLRERGGVCVWDWRRALFFPGFTPSRKG